MWQCALPPTLCTICLCVVCVQFSAAHQVSAPVRIFFENRGLVCEGLHWSGGYGLLAQRSQVDLEYWPKVIQSMIGKLYVLSLYYMMCVVSPSHTSLWFRPFLMSCLATLNLWEERCNRQNSLQHSYQHSLCQRKYRTHWRGIPELEMSRAIKSMWGVSQQGSLNFLCSLSCRVSPSFHIHHHIFPSLPFVSALLYR